MDDGVSGLSGSVIKSPIFQGRTSIQGQALYRALCEADSPDSKCPGCFASLRSEQGAAPLAPLYGYPCALCGQSNLLTQTAPPAKF